jgi:hypothetical protein
MRSILARFLAVVLTVLPWASTWLSAPKVTKTEASLSSGQQPPVPQASNLIPAPNFNPGSRDIALPPSFTTLEPNRIEFTALTQRPVRVPSSKKLFLTYSRMQLDGG